MRIRIADNISVPIELKGRFLDGIIIVYVIVIIIIKKRCW